MKITKTTCGPLYLDALQSYTEGDPEKVRLFAAGFINGQAEKVYLGACLAAMFRPSPERLEMVWEMAEDAILRYDLCGPRLLGDEVWIYRSAAGGCMSVLDELLRIGEAQSPQWHTIRGVLTGVPILEIDTQFHCRKGAGEQCDLPTK